MSVTFSMHAGQREVLDDPHRFKVVVAGRRFGKTTTAKLSILKAATKPKQLIWYVAPTYGMARSILWDDLRDALPKKLISNVNETRMTIRLVNGTKIELKGADNKDSLRGVGLNHLVLDETQDIEGETWTKVLRPTLASTAGTALIIGTPKRFDFFYDLYLLGQRGETYIDPKGQRRKNAWKSWQFPTYTSPFIPPSEIEQAKADMDEKTFRQEFLAIFETMSGRVYHSFDRFTHVGEYPFRETLPIIIGQDFNIDPMSSVIMQIQENGEVWIVDELVLFGSNTQEVADELARRYFRYQDRVRIYPDPAGSNRSHGRGESDLDILRHAGFNKIFHKRKHPRVSDRVNAVNRMFRAGDGQIRMRVNAKCKHTITSLEQTLYKEGSREVDKSASVEHQADALGYFVDYEYPIREITIMGISI